MPQASSVRVVMIEFRKTAYLCFDPRDPAQSLADRETWKPTDNAILISATMLLATYGEQYPISWDKVAMLADLCVDLMHDEPESTHAADAPPPPSIEDTNAMLWATLAAQPRVRPRTSTARGRRARTGRSAAS